MGGNGSSHILSLKSQQKGNENTKELEDAFDRPVLDCEVEVRIDRVRDVN